MAEPLNEQELDALRMDAAKDDSPFGALIRRLLANIDGGVSLRDDFAAQAIASGRIRMPSENPHRDGGPSPEMQTALEAYRVADAMLEARKQPVQG